MAETETTRITTDLKMPPKRRGRRSNVQAQMDIADRISEGIARGIQESRPKKVSIGEYTRREALAHPMPKSTYAIYQNGIPAQPSADAIRSCNRMTHGGRYLNRTVEVVFRDEGGDLSLNFVYANKTVDQRFENIKHWTSFDDLTAKIAKAQEHEDAEAPPKTRR